KRNPMQFSSRRSSASAGMTIIELLIAVTMTLIVMFAVVRYYAKLNKGLNRSRSVIEMSGELRNVAHRLQADLDGLTASTLPWTQPGLGDGYLEYIEGAQRDKALANAASITAGTTMFGDRDDVLAFTAKSSGKPFRGRYNGAIIESDMAEIVYFVSDSTQLDTEQLALYRRVLLIRPDLNTAGKIQVGPPAAVPAFFQLNDISVHSDGTNIIANSLADLTLRQNRSFHKYPLPPPPPPGSPIAKSTFPHDFDPTNSPTPIPVGHVDHGVDVALNRVVAFDVQVFDPLAPVRQGTTSALTPNDPGYLSQTIIGRGAFVDLNYAGSVVSFFSGPPNAKSQIPSATPTYSTWPMSYERDFVDQDGDAVADEGTDGFDNGGASGIADDPGEYETAPPYPHPIAGEKYPGLRALKVTLRIAEPSSREVRQASVVASFVPE
ncbi:MAG: hypothetical protein KDA71_21450, partial [Planctomycetales bacterium]|nr:hypothetical protein [Planctomycetales bacterium]